MKLKLGDGLQIPIEVAGQAVALVGIRGSGKTNTAGVIAEELLARGQQVVVIDPTDAWWGLRSDFPVFIFGGPHGDLALGESDGKTLAEFVVQERVPIILSLRHLRKGAQRRLVTEFCEELYHLKGKPEYRTPLTVFIDEAPQFVPQRVLGEMARLVGAVQDMILLGRNVGFGVVLISQRFATLNADVRTQADTIIVHRLPSPLDRKALNEWIEENATIDERKDVLSSLATLKTGEAWLWAPYFELFERAQIRPRKTFDSSAAPVRGKDPIVPSDLKKIDLEKLKGKFAATIEKAKADDPRELRKQLAEAIKMLARQATTIGELQARQPPAKAKVVEKPVITDAQLARLDASIGKLEAAIDRAADILTKPFAGVRGQLGQLTAAVKSVRQPLLPNVKMSTTSRQTARQPLVGQAVRSVSSRQAQRAHVARDMAVKDGLTEPAQRTLDSLAWWEAAGVAQPSREQVAFVARYSVNGHFNNTLGGLRANALVDYPRGNCVSLTEHGRAIAHAPAAAPTREELIARSTAILRDEPLRRLFTALVDAGSELSREDLAARTNYSVNGHFNNTLGRLRTLGLVTYPRGNHVALSEIFDALP